MGYQFCSKNCGFSIEHGSTIFRQNTNTEGAKMGYFHVTLTLLLSIAIMFAMTFHEALGNGECGPVGCPPGMKCVLAPPTPFVPMCTFVSQSEHKMEPRKFKRETILACPNRLKLIELN